MPATLNTSNRSAPACLRGMGIAAETLSAAFLIGTAGAVYAWGFDGLAFGLGVCAGLLLLQLTIVPGLSAAKARSVPEFFEERFGSGTVRLVACLAVVVTMAPLLVAQLMAAGLAGARLFGIGYATAVSVAGVVLVVCLALRRVMGAVWLAALVFALMLVAVLVPTIDLSAQWYGLPVPQLAYSNALWKAQELEETLLFDELADPTYMRTLIRPFLSLSLMNFLGLVLGLAAGTAAQAHVLARHVMAKPGSEARWGLVWAIAFAALLLSATTAVAAYFKLSLMTMIAGRVEIANLPEWVFTYGRMGLLDVCGRAATDLASVTAACAALPDASPVLRLQDLSLSPDMIFLALPDVAGLGGPIAGLVAAAVVVTAIVTADGPLRALAGALAGGQEKTPQALTYVIAAAAVLLAGLAALTRPSDVLTVATWGFLLAAGGIFPALFAAVWWRRASAAGIAAGMLAGLGVGLAYLIATRYFAVDFYAAFASFSNAGPMAQEFFGEYTDAWLSADPGAAKEAAWQVLDTQAQSMADLWGVRPVATALLAMPVSIVVLVAVSLVTPRRQQG